MDGFLNKGMADTVAFLACGAFKETCKFLGYDHIVTNVWSVLRKSVSFPSVWSGVMSLLELTLNGKGMLD